MQICRPRLVIAGTSGDSGKTVVSLGLLLALRQRGTSPVAFKKGPDYIDAAWLGWAASTPCRNLDTFLQPVAWIHEAVLRHGSDALNLIEGNRGLLDGMDLEGTHSTASLSRLLRAPVVLVVNATKVTRTVAAVVAGCRQLEPEIDLAGVILNQVAGARHEALTRQAVEQLAGVPVLGAVARVKHALLPDRHLGLVPPQERGQLELEQASEQIGRLVGHSVDLDRLVQIAQGAPPMEAAASTSDAERATRDRARIGVFSDSCFTFYYPENLEALEAAGAELVRISSLDDHALPDVDGLYLGGGFPETHAHRLSDNASLRRNVRLAAEASMPIYAECGGLIYLGRELRGPQGVFPMAGVLPLSLELGRCPAGHGYVELEVSGANPYFRLGQQLKGHEFHYTRVVAADWQSISLAFEVRRGTGAVEGKDGIVYKNVLGAYTHLHAAGAPEWAPALVDRAVSWRGGGPVGRAGGNEQPEEKSSRGSAC